MNFPTIAPRPLPDRKKPNNERIDYISKFKKGDAALFDDPKAAKVIYQAAVYWGKKRKRKFSMRTFIEGGKRKVGAWRVA